MICISTHLLDTALGKPAKDVAVRLERHDGSADWRMLGLSRTDADGRCSELVPAGDNLMPGIYRLTFDTAGYFAAQETQGLYPLVQVTFAVRDGEKHFHIPLLLSPNGYTTYRGS
jgi:5-hydroxyisourate hydrolase